MIDIDQGRIDLESADWLARRSEGCSPDESTAFGEWRKSDPRHARTFDAMVRTREDTATLRHLAGLAQIESKSKSLPTTRIRRLPRVAVVIAVTAIIVSLPLLNSAVMESAGHETGVAEVRNLTLDDGTIITLGAKSKIVVDFSPGQRRVDLTAGQAFFDVAHESGRPFVVWVRDTSIRDIGTKFDVTRAPDSVRVSVLEGLVEVRGTGAEQMDGNPVLEGRANIVQAGQRFESIQSASAAAVIPTVVQQVRETPTGAWRQGRLIYEDGRLADVVADLDRYYAPGVSISEDARELRVTASFRTDEIPSLLHTLEAALPVSVVQDARGAFRLRAR